MFLVSTYKHGFGLVMYGGMCLIGGLGIFSLKKDEILRAEIYNN